MRSRGIRALVGATVLAMTFAVPISASSGLSATLADKSISLDRAGTLSCHDFDYPVLRCFSTPAAMSLDVAGRAEGRSVSKQGFEVSDSGYVIVYEHSLYAGNYMILSADQAWLSSIGWNDKISSFKSFGATGNFRENSPASGLIYFFGSSAQIAYVGDSYNDKFSSFYIN